MLSNRNLVKWYAESTPGEVSDFTLWNTPVWIYKGLLLVWAVWLAMAFVHWLRFAWSVYRNTGHFRPKPRSGPRQRGPSGPPRPPSELPDRERARVS